MTEQTDAHDTLMTTALSMAEQTPDMMAQSLTAIEEWLIPLYEDAHAKGDTGVCAAIDGIWQQVQYLHSLATSQALGVASVGIVATGYKMQRDEALMELGRVSAAFEQLQTLIGGGR